MEPNFESYTLKELQECYESLDKTKWPERAMKMEELIKQKKLNPTNVSNQTKPIQQDLVMMLVIGLSVIVSISLDKVKISSHSGSFSYADNPFAFSIWIGGLLFLFIWYLSRYIKSKKGD
jgi:Fe-S cluster biosynthesis and repair protein YggX